MLTNFKYCGEIINGQYAETLNEFAFAYFPKKCGLEVILYVCGKRNDHDKCTEKTSCQHTHTRAVDILTFRILAY